MNRRTLHAALWYLPCCAVACATLAASVVVVHADELRALRQLVVPSATPVALAGMIQSHSIVYGPGEREVRFTVGTGDRLVTVSHAGLRPDTFGDGRRVRMRGHMRADGVYVASELILPCGGYRLFDYRSKP